jgi:opacity protein-like surface antigen
MKKRIVIAMLNALMLPLTIYGQHAEQMLGLDSQQRQDNSKDWSQSVLAISYNPGFITSKVFVGYNEESWIEGHGFSADFRHVFRSGFGFGLSFSHSQTNFEYGWKKTIPLRLEYLGPSFVMANPVGEHWHARLSFGLGYAHYSDGNDSEDGFGYQFMAGVEYRLGSVFALGIDLTETVHRFSQQDYDYGNKDMKSGFSRLGLNVGLRLYM